MVHIADLAAETEWERDDPKRHVGLKEGIGTALFVPLRKDGRLVGYLSADRQEVKPFAEREIALLQSFAAQAVIAMENARLINETREALEQQTATAEVLQVINSSPGELAPVFSAMLEKAMALCGAAFGVMNIHDGEVFRPVADRGIPVAYAEFRERNPSVSYGPGTAPARLLGGEDLVHNADLKAEEAYVQGEPQRRAIVDLGGARSHIAVALRRDGAFLGYLAVYRQEVRPFSDKQIALLQNFAAQAVIAMENARLLGELRERTRDLEESLEYQTATSEVLNVISRSTFDLQPIFDTIVSTAARLCDADDGIITIREGDAYKMVSSFAAVPEFDAAMKGRLFPVNRDSLTGRTALDGDVVHITDIASDPDYTQTETLTLQKNRTMLGVPLLRDESVVGTINLGRLEVEPFTERQIELVRTFADQAVIAMENARLLGELRERTRDLEESLEYQTATSDVLKGISRSTFDLQPVLDTLVETAGRLCQAEMTLVSRREGEVYRMAASYGFPVEFGSFLRSHPIAPDRGTMVGRVVLDGGVFHVADVAGDP
jgi:GAF domain-containing protein